MTEADKTLSGAKRERAFDAWVLCALFGMAPFFTVLAPNDVPAGRVVALLVPMIIFAVRAIQLSIEGSH